jgi:pyridoxal phosphate enzyme (YggS family)
MAVNTQQYNKIINTLQEKNVRLVAVSKVQPAAAIEQLYALGQRDFGENYVQELVEKYEALPKDINWHFIGHLQSNKVKYIAPFVHLIHGIDSLKLLEEVNKQAKKNNRVIDCLLQVHIAQEETKFGLNAEELQVVIDALQAGLAHVRVKGLMGMSSFSDDLDKVRNEMRRLKELYDQYKDISQPNLQFTTLSMGMSGDYEIAIQEGSNMVRIGSLLFGARL